MSHINCNIQEELWSLIYSMIHGYLMTNISSSADQAATKFTRWIRTAPMYMKAGHSLTVLDMYGTKFKGRNKHDDNHICIYDIGQNTTSITPA